MSVVRLRRKGGKIVQDCDIYVGRECVQGGWELEESDWANPYSANKYGREECLRKYEEYIRARPDLMARLGELKGKTLGCWCVPEACHGHVLLKLLAEQN
jgi:hypothetical protein